MNNCVIAFDLDDTLYKEADYVKSGYIAILNKLREKYPIDTHFCLEKMLNSDNAFASLLKNISDCGYKASENINDCLEIYRNHHPEIKLDNDAITTLTELKNRDIPLAIITDGRIISQTNKINALGLNKFINFEQIFISEEIGCDKLYSISFEMLMKQYPHHSEFIYIGDNLSKDFLWPNKLGWKTICVRSNGANIHPQNFNCSIEYLPQNIVNNISEILKII